MSVSAPEPRRVLIATISMAAGTGTAVYTRDLALALLRRGHTPIVYTTSRGALGDELRANTIPVVSDLDQLAAPPDVIHGHHQLETLVAVTRFPRVPALFVCHDGLAWHSIPPIGSRFGSYVAVDRNCRDRMMFEHAIPEASIHVLANPVDLRRFPRRSPLPPKPKRALVFSNNAVEAWVKPIRLACESRGIALDVAGSASGHPLEHPEKALPSYDLVFGKARCALEAMAVGAAVIVCDAQGLAGLATTESLEAGRSLNFGARTLRRAIDADAIGAEIDRYDAVDAAAVCERIRVSADVDLLADQFIDLYDDLCAQPPREHDDLLIVSRSLSRMATQIYAQGIAGATRPSIVRRMVRRIRKRIRKMGE